MIGRGIGGVGSLAQIELRKQNILRIETEIHSECFAEATQRDKSCRHSNAAERNLRGEQHIAKGPAASRGGLGSASLNRVIWIGFEYLAQRHYAEHDAGKDGDDEGHQDQ